MCIAPYIYFLKVKHKVIIKSSAGFCNTQFERAMQFMKILLYQTQRWAWNIHWRRLLFAECNCWEILLHSQ